MKQESAPHRHRIAALFAAAAFLSTPSFAQEAQPATSPAEGTAPAEADSTLPADAAPAPVTVTPPASVQTTPVAVAPPAAAASPAAEEPTPARQRQARSAVRPAARTLAEPRGAAPVRQRAQAPAPLEPGLAADTASIAETPAPIAELPAAPPPEAEIPAPVETARSSNGIAPELLAGLAALGALGLIAFLTGRRRRRRLVDETYESYEEPLMAAEPVSEPQPQAVMTAPVSHAPERAPIAPVAAAAPVSTEGGRPWIDFEIRPVRAGVGEGEAVVEFEMTVGNTGSVTARDVRVSTWMLAAGSPQESEMERLLIQRSAENSEPGVTIDPGNGRRIEAAVAMPTSELEDSILPVVVADVRYRLPDGSEGRTSASFTVGVPHEGELAHFDVEHPSGLHEGVEARLRGQQQRV